MRTRALIFAAFALYFVAQVETCEHPSGSYTQRATPTNDHMDVCNLRLSHDGDLDAWNECMRSRPL